MSERVELEHERALARVNVAAIERNCARMLSELDGGSLCAVVKADGYGHGALPAAIAAIAGGASRLAVASVREARELVDEVNVPLLIMGPIETNDLEEVVDVGYELLARSERLVKWVGELTEEIGTRARLHVKLDSGMGRLGTRDPEQASRIVAAIDSEPSVDLAGVMTHFATADEREGEFFEEQLERFTEWALPIKRTHPETLVHAANSAATLREARAHFDMVRCGISIYGMDPFGEDPAAQGLEPALELSSYLAEVKECAVGESTGYGRRFVAERGTQLGVVPIGYGDGWRRALSNNAEVLVEGRRHPLVGTISMDSFAVDLGPGPAGEELRSAEVVLIGARGSERITAEEVARRIETINYEVTCGLTARVVRVYHRDGERLPDYEIWSE
ncbi:MAG TPA: alanine racemase [Solirubrobacteraceae bacterium]|nr:alanine racemase [Solirubrobacteraceae bacterium]